MSRAKAKKTASVGTPAEAEVRIGDYVVHPYRVAVPEMPADLLEALVERTRESGQLYPVTVDREGRVLDGRAQLRACLTVGLEPKTVVTDRTDLAWVIVDSIRRTTYTGAQCSVLAAELLEPLEREARDRQRTAGKPLPENSGEGGEAIEIAAKAVGKTNATYVHEARALIDSRSDVLPLIATWKIERMSHAIRLAKVNPTKRRVFIARIEAGEDPAIVLREPKKSDDEWLTPEDIAEAVRAAFGGTIMCDPCSPETGSNVKATYEYTKSQDGLSDNNPWHDRTFVNPPFSKPKLWIERAIREANAGKRLYFLLPLHPDSTYQEALLRASVDVLLLAGRVEFEKPNAKSDGVGRNSIMIAGLLCSTQDLVDIGIEGMVVRTAQMTSGDHSADLVALDEARSSGKVPYPGGVVTRKEETDARALAEIGRDERDARIAHGRKQLETLRVRNFEEERP